MKPKKGIIATLVGEYKAPDGSTCFIFDNQEGGVNLFITDVNGELIAIVSETTITENEDGSGKIIELIYERYFKMTQNQGIIC